MAKVAGSRMLIWKNITATSLEVRDRSDLRDGDFCNIYKLQLSLNGLRIKIVIGGMMARMISMHSHQN